MNFCTHEIGTTITSTEGEVEDYEVENLLQTIESRDKSTEAEVSGNKSRPKLDMGYYSGQKKLRKEFMSLARPPVLIKLKFPIPIDISHIVFSPKVGNQISKAFQIESEIIPQPQPKKQNRQQRTEVSTEDCITTAVIGREFLQTNDSVPDLIVFRNPRFILRREFHSLNLREFEQHRNYPEAFTLKHPYPVHRACEDVVCLTITILRSNFSAVLGSLRIWGQPSSKCSKSEVDSIMNKFGFSILDSSNNKNSSRVEEANDNLEESGEEPRRKILKEDTEIDSGVHIPEEFLDPITFEVMCQPIRLPSGLAVDSTTMEKFTNAEAMWGRPAKDPFTGICFSEKSQPLPDLALKSRIDTFLTKHSEVTEFLTLPRTLGRSFGKTSTIVRPSISVNKLTVKNPGISSEVVGVDPGPSQNLNNSQSTDLVSQEVAKLLRGSISYLTKPQSTSTSLVTNVINTHYKADEVDSSKCGCCKISRKNQGSSPSVPFYKSSCDHIFLCRNCILINNTNASTKYSDLKHCYLWKCNHCESELQSKDMYRIHD